MRTFSPFTNTSAIMLTIPRSNCNDSLLLVQLDLGMVNMIAEVFVNGEKVRTVWCSPYSLDISQYVKQGENNLQVKVTSTWFNRLVHDASLPEAERKTWTISGPSADAKLKEYGLLGPVNLKY